ncbi:MAG: N-6 DNA methylase [Deltaproteobacteria bacterium]|nr:N-6 DNA methylase [Deltaproteobacteria bacterium]
MSKVLINKYYNNLDRALQFGKSKNETSIRNHFWTLLNEYARKQNYELVPEVKCPGTIGKPVIPDGIVKNSFGLDIGLWESKDEKDTLDNEIAAKFKKGYPNYNILFENSKTVVLFQRGQETMRVSVRDVNKLHNILTEFVSFKSANIHKFEEALGKFKEDIPVIVETLRNKINDARINNKKFIEKSQTFLELCKAEINPDIRSADIREMIIQHILTGDIFNKIFDDSDFHRHNNIAKELEKLIETLFTYPQRKNLIGNIEHYYDTINNAAAGIADHKEKQKFLKVLYENFYKVYNPKAADRLGVVYTPNEIVEFMIEGADHLLYKHFNKTLSDKNIEILDPATGTGTFMTSIIDYIPTQNLLYKYNNEIYANEVSILSYYIANLNIEFTFKQKIGYYQEFQNLCFVDTLDNTDSLSYSGKQTLAFGLTSENAKRIKRQNEKKISVIIGNPPYNANQANENENNKNREYKEIDKRIKDTYVKKSSAQKTKAYDMYSRFYRWASDRLDKNGIIAFITNNSFINAKTFDGFRRCVRDEFDYAYIIDLGGNIRELSGKDGIWMNEKHTIFGVSAAVGIAIMFLVKKKLPEKLSCQINYIHPTDIRATRLEKLDYLYSNKFENIPFKRITPDKNNNWIDLAEDNDWETLEPLANKETKLGRKGANAIFKLFSLGVVTARDEWVYDFNELNLKNKVKFFIEFYEKEKKRWNKSKKDIPINDFVDRKIKWTSELEAYLKKGSLLKYDKSKIITSLYRPYIKKYSYFDRIITHRIYRNENIFGIDEHHQNKVIAFRCVTAEHFVVLAADQSFDLAFLKMGNGGTFSLPYYSYNKNGERTENITDWGLKRFTTHYKDNAITKEDIFHYIYAVLHNPAYIKKYKLNLKREFPRIPFYNNFKKWVGWGKALMDLHINYQEAKPFDLKISEVEINRFYKKGSETLLKIKPDLKVKLKADKPAGSIEIDEETNICGIPKEAWEYKLGNRSALEWIIDQYKKKKIKDPTIAEKFNSYKFADYKPEVIDLIKKVCSVSVETIKIINEIKAENSALNTSAKKD